jgi:hypothetical protein
MLEQVLLNGLIAGSIYSLVALGFSLIYQTTRFFPRLRFPRRRGRPARTRLPERLVVQSGG